MASIQVSGGHAGRRPVDHDVPLVPFIDLLLCCVMFLLVTAVWNQLAAVRTLLDAPGDPTARREADTPHLVLHLRAEHLVLGSSLGDHLEIPRDEGLASLRTVLAARRAAEPADVEVAVIPDDGIRYDEMIATVDALLGAGFGRVGVRDRE